MPKLADFKIDCYEVTNSEFKEFVDAGGYEDPAYWVDTLGLNWQKVVDGFRDKRDDRFFGPAFWVSGIYAHGTENRPVTGVSWYEAMAYAKWKRKRLPTIYHWLRAAEFDGFYDRVNMADVANIGGRYPGALASRGQDNRLSVSYSGAFDLSGNVREWCLNEEQAGNYYALGGSWSSEAHTTFSPASYSALDRLNDLGFRCAVYEEQGRAVEAAPIQWRSFEESTMEIDRYRSLFDYDAESPFECSKVKDIRIGDRPARFLEIDAAYGSETLLKQERIPVYMVLPDSKFFSPPYQTVIVLPWDSSQKDSNQQPTELGWPEVDRIVESGRAVVFPIYWATYERRTPDFTTPFADPTDFGKYTRTMVKIGKDFSRTVDFIESYEENGQLLFNPEKIAVYADNWGANKGAIWIVADELVKNRKRFQAIVFRRCGLVSIPQPKEVDQVTYTPHLKVPTLMINLKSALAIPYEQGQKAMYDVLPLPEGLKKHFVIPRARWSVSVRHFEEHAIPWFDRWLDKPTALSTRASGRTNP